MGESNINVNKHIIYYNSPVGIAGYQAVLCEHLYWVASEINKNSPLIIDIGANVGYFTLGMKDHYKSATIHCFEPEKTTYRALVKNVKHLKGIRINQLAVGASNCNMSIVSNGESSALTHLTDDKSDSSS